jgi:hypothetical protein
MNADRTADQDQNTDRDRDSAGRPRNARPRDGLGRPLDRAAIGEPPVPDGLHLAPAESAALAQELIDDGRPFHAHEVLEAAWKSAPEDERDMWQGLAQIAVGLTHALRGNDRGAVALLRRGATALGPDAPNQASHSHATHSHATHQPVAGCLTARDQDASRSDPGHTHSIDIVGTQAAARTLADLIEQTGLAAIPAARLRLQISR